MKLIAEVAGENHELTMRRDNQRVSAKIAERHYELELRDLQQGEYLLIDAAGVYHCHTSSNRQQHNVFLVHLRGRSYEVRITDPKRLRRAQSEGSHDRGKAQIVAPMPGKVVRVLVEVGAQVEAGAGIVVVEAMKMQNEMKSPKTGTVISIAAGAGNTVNAGDVLAVIE